MKYCNSFIGDLIKRKARTTKKIIKKRGKNGRIGGRVRGRGLDKKVEKKVCQPENVTFFS